MYFRIAVAVAMIVADVPSHGTMPAGIRGTVVVADASGAPTEVSGVPVSLRCDKTGESVQTAITDAAGSFSFPDIAPDHCALAVDNLQFEPKTQVVDLTPGQTLELQIPLSLRKVQETLVVTANSTNALDTTTSSTAPPPLQQTALQSAPVVDSAFQDALPLVPGVVRGPDGQIDVKGGRPDQGMTLVNSVTGTDPVTGKDAVSLPLDAIESVNVFANPFSAEYGGFSSGITTVETRSGTDHWKFLITNFLPRPRRRAGTIMGLASATPRLTVAGPLLPNRAYLFQSFDYRFERTSVPSLPPLQHDKTFENFDSSTQLDWDPVSNHHVSGNFLWYPENVRYALLNTFMPEDSNPDFRRRGYLAAVSDRAIFGQNLLESAISVKKYDAHVSPASATPGEFVYYPQQDYGAWYDRQDRNSWLDQWSETWRMHDLTARGRHSLVLGSSFTHEDVDGSVENGQVLVKREDHTTSQQIDFAGPASLSADDNLVALFVQDHWATPWHRLSLDIGVRWEHDELSQDAMDVAPRLGFVMGLTKDNRTILRGGAGWFYDKIPLNVGTFGRYPEESVLRFSADGITPAGNPLFFEHQVASPSWRLPYSLAWDVQLDREIGHGVTARIGYDERHTRHEFFLQPEESPAGDSLQLWNTGGQMYRDFEGTVRWEPTMRTRIVASYVHSRAEGDLNAFEDYFGDFPNPIIRPNQYGLLPHDVPDRLVTWGSVGLPWKFELWPVLDIHSGFPWSRVNDDLNFVGTRNSERYPEFASLDMQLIRPVQIPWLKRDHRARVGVKVFNLTSHVNPRDVQNNLSSPEFGQYYNSLGRQFGGKFEFNF